MSHIDAIILGIVEGITEFFPISSTGHLILASSLLRLPETDFLKTFQIAIQLGAILAIVVLYWKKLLFDRELLMKLIVALFPSLVVGFFLYSFIRRLFDFPLVVVGALFVGGIIIVVFERIYKHQDTARITLSTLSYKKALGIGLFQAFSVIPGVSRAGATILGGLALELERKAIVEFSFLLAVPTMLAATALDLWKHGALFSQADVWLLLTGFVTAFLVAIAAVKFLLKFVETNTFVVFGIYRIVLALIFFLFFL